MMRIPRAGLLVLLVGASCSSKKHTAYERLAEELNPVLRQLQSTAVAVRSASHSDPPVAAWMRTCGSLEQPLAALRDLRLDDVIEEDMPRRSSSLSWWAGTFLDWWKVGCAHVQDAPRSRDCAVKCLDNLQGVFDRVSALRESARSEGIDILPL